MKEQELIAQALESAMGYGNYRSFMEHHKQEGTYSGEDDNPKLAEYTVLNHQRMKRLDKTLKLGSTCQSTLSRLDRPMTWLVLTESWCGDAAQSLPVMAKMAAATTHLDIKVALRDQNKELMDLYLTNGGRSIPKLLFINSKTNDVLADWGPRPEKLTQMVADYKKEHGKITEEFVEQVHAWYTKNRGKETMRELCMLIKSLG